MNQILLLALSMAACLAATLLRKLLADRYETGGTARQIYNAVTSLTAAAVLLVLADFTGLSLFTAALGAAFGLITALQQIATLRAVEVGPLSYTTVITSLSMLIPALSGALFWNESISIVQIVGIALMVGCLALSVETGGAQEERKKASLRWLLYCGAAFLCTGLIGLMQKWHQNSVWKDERDALLVIAFAVSFLISAILWIRSAYAGRAARAGRDGRSAEPAPAKKSILGWLPLLLLVVSGVCIAANNKLNLYLSGVIDSAVFFPIVNGGGLVLTTLFAFLLFRERLARRQWVGLLLGVLATLCLCNPFA